jgi:5-methylcytosine-specific restriction endonuclease McrA
VDPLDDYVQKSSPLRSKSALKARVRLRRKAARPKRPPPVTCAVRGCRRRPTVLELCRSHATAEADRLFSQWIRQRDRVCQECGAQAGLQCAHLWSRRYRALRWDEEGAVALCLRCHKQFTEDPAAWNAWIRARRGDEEFWRLNARARTGAAPELAVILPLLRERMGEAG